MANTYFKFKQFTVNQSDCAMKVCTDSCIFGASFPVVQAGRMLDIGTGTGLLALMVAQRTSQAEIVAIEINETAARQAKENIENSPWSDRISLFQISLQEFEKTNPEPFDVIFSNPPFFQSSLKSADEAKNSAKHTGTLQFDDILSFAKNYLKPDGKLSILLPPSEMAVFEKLALKGGFFVQNSLSVFTATHGKLFRVIQTYSFKQTPVTSERLYIRENDTTYTSAFKKLLQDYYLIF